MNDNFLRSLDLVLKAEGGFSQHPDDPGGMTNLGVTKRVWENFVGHEVSETDMRLLTKDIVTPLYLSKYWDKVRGDSLPDGVDYLVFDFAVNAGPSRAIKTLQQALHVVSDGILGPQTMQAIHAADPEELIDDYSKAKSAFYRGLGMFPTFGKGWLNRVTSSATEARTMIG